MEIIVFDSTAVPATIDLALRDEGHRVQRLARLRDEVAADVVLLDATAWPSDDVTRLAMRLPHAEMIIFVDDLDHALPNESAMALLKPINVDKLLRLMRVIDEARSGVADPRDLLDFETLFCGESPAIVDLLRQVRLFAQSDASVWIHGELGSGRAVVARAIHDRSMRQAGPFVAVNAAAFPGVLLDEHLFGEEGAVQAAVGGTLFLDLVAEVPPATQAQLLRVIDERADIRVMVGDDQQASSGSGRLQRELHQRLKVHELALPPLRERARDLGAIIRRMLDRLRTQGAASPLSAGALKALEAYPFPGNVRELAHALTHAVVLSQGRGIEVRHLPQQIQRQPAEDPLDPDALESLETVAKRFERGYLLRVLRAVGGNRTRAARILNLSRKGLWQKLKAHGIAPEEGREPADDAADISNKGDNSAR